MGQLSVWLMEDDSLLQPQVLTWTLIHVYQHMQICKYTCTLVIHMKIEKKKQKQEQMFLPSRKMNSVSPLH